MSEKKYPIGIDLGTVNSVLAVHRDNKTEIIDCQGVKITPSRVFYHPNENDVTIGNIEELDIEKHRNGCIYDSKRLIGRSYEDSCVKNNKNKFTFTIEPTNTNGIHIPVTHNGRLVHLTPQQVSSEILKVLKQSAEDYLGYKIKEAVITVPAYFNFSQRSATKEAANLAGLEVLMLLNEPTAACLHYLKERNESNSLSIVFDLGGGTLDISIVKISDNGIEVVGVDGDTWLGGRNFDETMVEHFINKYKLKLDKRQRQRLLKAIESIKHTLSYKSKASKYIEYFNSDSGLLLELTKAEFEEINSPLFEQCLNVMKRCLEKSSIKKENIQNIILVGGSTKIPKIKQLVRGFFEKEVKTDVDPDEAVACGAAIQAASMKGLSTARFKVADVTPFSLGTRLIFDEMYTVIKYNTPIPAEHSVRIVTTYHNQPELTSKIYEGERLRCRFNNFLGSYTVRNLPQKPAGEVVIVTTFSIDESGLLKVTAKEESTGENTKLEVNMELRDLKMINNMQLICNTEEDIRFLRFIEKLKTFRHVCIKYMNNKSEKDTNVMKCTKFASDLEDLEFEEMDKLNDLVKSFKDNLIDERLRQQISSIYI